jgi:alpha-glucoside transport system substrate-binding protein
VPLKATPSVKPFEGTRVTVGGVEDQQLVKELEHLSAATGIDIMTVDSEDELVTHQPDIVFVPQPGWVASLAGLGHLMSPATYLDMPQLRRDYSPYLLSLGTVAADGSWPSDHGTLYGVPVDLNLKSLIWYPVPEFRRAGYAVPETWEELLALTDRMIADGRTPWCMGLESGDASGWPATDWIENLLLRGAGPRVYDRWTSHEIAFDDAAVRRAFDRFGQIVFRDDALFQGRDGAVVTPWSSAQVPMVDGDPPKCWLYHFPSFASSVLPPKAVGTSTDAFPFPSLSPANPDEVLGGLGTALVFADRPEVREVVRFLASPAFGQDWFAAGTGLFSANGRFDLSGYDPLWRSQANLLRNALAADTFRLDGGDLMPPKVGRNAFWDAMIRYMQTGPDSLDAILADLEAAWPNKA